MPGHALRELDAASDVLGIIGRNGSYNEPWPIKRMAENRREGSKLFENRRHALGNIVQPGFTGEPP